MDRSIHRPTLLAILAAGIVSGAAAVAWQISSGSAADPADSFVVAQSTRVAAGDKVVATVNGVSIPLSRVVRLSAFAGVIPSPGIDLNDQKAAIESAVVFELGFQEASRRGLVPKDEDVLTFIRQQQESIQAEANAGRLPADAATALRGLEKIGYGVEDWDTNPEIIDMYRRLFAVTALSNDELSKRLATLDRDDSAARSKILDELAKKLREEAKVEIFNVS